MTHRLTRRSVAKGIALSAGALALPTIGRAQVQSVKIAMIAPMSGPWARQGQLLRMGADLAIEDINARGGIKSLGGTKLNIIYGDAGDSTEKAKNAAQRLVADNPDLVGGTGSWLSSFTLAVTEVTERMAAGAPQADGSVAVEPRFDVRHVADAVLYMASLPLDANVQFMTVMATKMPFIGRG